MKISVVTVCRNASSTIENTICTVAAQKHTNLEHIIVDGSSTDGTLNIIHRYKDNFAKWVSEHDHGIYEAMNKGIAMATGDVIGFLNADDIYAHSNVLTNVATVLENSEVQACYGDVVFVRDDLETIVRYYRSREFSPKKLAYGWMPAHPALFLEKELFDKYGCFKTDYRIAADYELITRLFGRHRIQYKYLPEIFVKMRMGGISTRGIRSSYILNKEIVRACTENGISTNLPKVFLKFPLKFMELFLRPS